MRFAYADPPYVGQAKKHYADHPDYAGEVDHVELIAALVSDYPDGWALSLSAASLPQILPLCPPDVRVLAWVKSMVHMLPGIRLQYGWEPVILSGGRQGPHRTGDPMLRDYVVCHPGEEEFNEIGGDERAQFLEAAEAAMAVWFGDSARRLRVYREGYDDGYHDGRGAR